MKRTACFVALLLVGASPTRAGELQLPAKCEVSETLFEQARQELAETCSKRIKELEDKREADDAKAKLFTTLSITTGILAAGGAAALTAIPGIGTAIQAADPPRPAVTDDPTTGTDETALPYPGAQPGPALAVAQLAVGVATGIFSTSAAGFASLAVFSAPSPEETGALQTELNSARAAANSLALVPVLALDDQKHAKDILRDAAAKCAISNPKPRDEKDVQLATRDILSRVSATATVAGEVPLPVPPCLPSLEHDEARKLWMGTDADGMRVLLKYGVDERDKTQVNKICSLDDTLTEKNCTEDPSVIGHFLEEFPDAKP